MISPTTTSVNSVLPTTDGSNNLEVGLQRLAKKNPRLFASVMSQIQATMRSNSASGPTRGQFGYQVADPNPSGTGPQLGAPSQPFHLAGPTLTSATGAPQDPELGAPSQPHILSGSTPTTTSGSTQIGAPSEPFHLSGGTPTTTPGTSQLTPPSQPHVLGDNLPTATSGSTQIGAPSEPFHLSGQSGATEASGAGKKFHHGHHSHDSADGSSTASGASPSSWVGAAVGLQLTGGSTSSASGSSVPLENSQKLQANAVSGLPIFDRNGTVNSALLPAFASLFSTSGTSASSSSSGIAVVNTSAGSTVAVTLGNSRGVDVQA